MKSFKFLLFTCSIVLFCSCALNQNYQVKRDLKKINKTLNEQCFVGIDITNLSQNKSIYRTNQNHLFTPASTLKLFTSYLALKQEGVSYRFHTQLLYNGSITDSILKGDILIKASGDPTLASAFCNKQESEHFSQWEKIISNAGIKKIHGNISLIKNQNLSPKYQPGWQIDDIGTNYQSMISEFIYHDNRMALRIFSDSTIVKIEIDSSYINLPISNQIKIDSNTSIRITKNNNGDFILNGNIRPLDEKIVYVSIDEPETYFLNSFRQYLTKKSYYPDELLIQEINGNTINTDSLNLLFDFVSLPLDSICFYINNFSVNSYAEQINQFLIKPDFKQKELKRLGIDQKTRIFADGSGLSVYNKLSPSDFTLLLQAVYQDSLFTPFLNSLSIGGERGTLRKRIDQKQVISKVYGKSGSMSNISNSVCLIKGNDGQWYSVVLMLNNIPRGFDVSNYLQEICIILEKYLIKH